MPPPQAASYSSRLPGVPRVNTTNTVDTVNAPLGCLFLMFLLTKQWLGAWFSLSGLRWAWEGDAAGAKPALGMENEGHERLAEGFVPRFVIDYGLSPLYFPLPLSLSLSDNDE